MPDDEEMLARLKQIGYTLAANSQPNHAAAICWAVARIGELEGALEELLKSGTHDGPCDNEDHDPDTGEFYVCTIHVATAEARRARAHALLAPKPPAKETEAQL